MLTPFDHKGTDLYKYICLISQNLVSMLEVNKENVKLSQRDNSTYFEIAFSRQAYHQIQKDNKEEVSKHYLLDTKLTKDHWFSKDSLDITTIANLTAYCIQVIKFISILKNFARL